MPPSTRPPVHPSARPPVRPPGRQSARPSCSSDALAHRMQMRTCARSSVLYAWCACWLCRHTYTLCRNPLRLKRFHWRWSSLETSELILLRRLPTPLNCRFYPRARHKVQTLICFSKNFSNFHEKHLKNFSNFSKKIVVSFFFRNFLEISKEFLKNF